MGHATITTQIKQIRLESEGTASFDLLPANGQALPPFTPGAHVDVHIPGGLVRSYSLVNCPAESSYYRIAVKREDDSRGGSAWLHDEARVGMTLEISAPSNNFELDEAASSSILIAGGIGITPLMSMVAHLVELGRPWQLHYCARSAVHMAFREELERLESRGQGQVQYYLDDTSAMRLDIGAIVQGAPEDTHLYCCGPSGMIEAFIATTQKRPQHTVHYERFSATQEAATDGGFEVRLARDGRSLTVPAGKTILDTLLDAGLDVPYACTQGICGSCMTTVLDGTPDHRDECLSDEQREANNSIIICCSGSRTKTLTLDL
jgi:ferredoxin-NADP reductase